MRQSDPQATGVPRGRIILYLAGSSLPATPAVGLARAGFEVLTVTQFQQAAGWLMLYRDSAIVVVHPSGVDAVRRNVFDALRLIGPGIPIVALISSWTPEVQRDLDRITVFRALSTEAQPDQIVDVVLDAFASWGGTALAVATDDRFDPAGT